MYFEEIFEKVVTLWKKEFNLYRINETESYFNDIGNDFIVTTHSRPRSSRISSIRSGHYADDGKYYPNNPAFLAVKEYSGNRVSAKHMNEKFHDSGVHIMYHPQTKTSYEYNENYDQKMR